MAQPIYSTSVQIPLFSGLNQTGDGHNMNMQYAWEMENVNVEGGSFQPMREGLLMEQELTKPIGTLARLHRRYGQNTGTVLVAISNGEVYTKELDGTDAWVKRYPGVGQTALTVDDCDWLTYEVNERGGQALSAPVDVLLFTNAKDGMFCLYGDNLTVEAKPVIPDPDHPTDIIKFGVIARYNERIWGAGIDGDPDKLMYSAPFDPFDWEPDTASPADGAGDILQPSWDGDRFVALRQYGDNLLAVKRNSIWRIYGTDPSSFTMSQQYGGGTIVENTFTVFNDRAYMLGPNGLMIYDGTGAYPFNQETVSRLFQDHVNKSAIDKACAWMRDRTYCLALPVNESTFCNAILEYNTAEKSFALRTEISVDSFLQVEDRLFYTSATEPGRVFELQDKIGMPLPCKWVSCWQDLGLKNSIKSAFIVYMMVDSEAPVELRVGIQTEKKLKQKIIYTKPGKMTRLHLNLQGREFRLQIQSFSAIPFTISGGIRIDLELDPD